MYYMKMCSCILLFAFALAVTSADRWNHSRGRHFSRRHHSEENLDQGDMINMTDSSGVSHTFLVDGQSTILRELNRPNSGSSTNIENKSALCSSGSSLNGPLLIR